jgi:hypothetical protein
LPDHLTFSTALDLSKQDGQTFKGATKSKILEPV